MARSAFLAAAGSTRLASPQLNSDWPAIAPRTTSSSHSEVSTISVAELPPTIRPWFWSRIARGAGPPMRSSNAQRASRGPGPAGAARSGGLRTHKTRSPNSASLSSAPRLAHVTKLIVVGWVCRTRRSGRSTWNRVSTDGRRWSSGPSRAASATRITSSVPPTGAPSAPALRAGPHRRRAVRQPRRSAAPTPEQVEEGLHLESDELICREGRERDAARLDVQHAIDLDGAVALLPLARTRGWPRNASRDR